MIWNCNGEGLAQEMVMHHCDACKFTPKRCYHDLITTANFLRKVEFCVL